MCFNASRRSRNDDKIVNGNETFSFIELDRKHEITFKFFYSCLVLLLLGLHRRDIDFASDRLNNMFEMRSREHTRKCKISSWFWQEQLNGFRNFQWKFNSPWRRGEKNSRHENLNLTIIKLLLMLCVKKVVGIENRTSIHVLLFRLATHRDVTRKHPADGVNYPESNNGRTAAVGNSSKVFSSRHCLAIRTEK